MLEVQPAGRPSAAAQPSEEEPEPAPPEPGGEQAGAGDHVLHQQEDGGQEEDGLQVAGQSQAEISPQLPQSSSVSSESQ